MSIIIINIFYQKSKPSLVSWLLMPSSEKHCKMQNADWIWKNNAWKNLKRFQPYEIHLLTFMTKLKEIMYSLLIWTKRTNEIKWDVKKTKFDLEK